MFENNFVLILWKKFRLNTFLIFGKIADSHSIKEGKKKFSRTCGLASKDFFKFLCYRWRGGVCSTGETGVCRKTKTEIIIILILNKELVRTYLAWIPSIDFERTQKRIFEAGKEEKNKYTSNCRSNLDVLIKKVYS